MKIVDDMSDKIKQGSQMSSCYASFLNNCKTDVDTSYTNLKGFLSIQTC